MSYLGVYIDQHLNWNLTLFELKPELSRAVGIQRNFMNGLLSDFFIATHLCRSNLKSKQYDYQEMSSFLKQSDPNNAFSTFWNVRYTFTENIQYEKSKRNS